MASTITDQPKNSISSSSTRLVPLKPDCIYTNCYCEENVWMLCNHIKEKSPQSLGDVFVLFISNEEKSVPLWKQKSQKNPSYPVVWDYHVILLHSIKINDQFIQNIYDLDSILPFPCALSSYVEEAFGRDETLKRQFHRFIRVVPAPLYLDTFASDRSHMKKEDNSWQSPPPSYPCIFTSSCTMNLDSFISMETRNLGTVFSLNDFKSHFEIKL